MLQSDVTRDEFDSLGNRVNTVEGDFKVVKSKVNDLETKTACLPDMNTRLALQGQTLKSINKLLWAILGATLTLIIYIITKLY